MPLYLWKGAGQMEEATLDRARPPRLTRPSSPTDSPNTAERTRLYSCKVDGCTKRRFKKAMIAARHFNSAHSDLRENEESWREYIEEIWE